MSKPTRKSAHVKAGKSRPPFPFTAHPRGHWCKKVRGRIHYFGKIADDPQGDKALALWLAQKEDLLAGRTPAAQPAGAVTVAKLCNDFQNHKRLLLESGEIKATTFAEYRASIERLAKQFGRDRPVDDLVADDFAKLRHRIAKVWGPVRLGNEIQRVRSVFKFGYESGLLDKPPRFGPGFKKPSDRVLRLHRKEKGKRLFDVAELHRMIDAAGPQLKAMILLGVNAGMGCTDCAMLPMKALNLKTGWLDFPREKTGIDRRVPLWPETIAAIRQAIAARPQPQDERHKGLAFVTVRGKCYGQAKQTHWLVSAATTKLLTKLGLRRPGVGFYSLRHTLETIGSGARDQAALDHIMGHAPNRNDMAARYREEIEDSRLLAVTEHVRKWLFPVVAKDAQAQ